MNRQLNEVLGAVRQQLEGVEVERRAAGAGRMASVHAKVDGKPVGGISLDRRSYDGRAVLAVANIRILRPHRGKGLGKLLYREASRWAREMGLPLASDTVMEPAVEQGWKARAARGEAEEIVVRQGRPGEYGAGRAYVEV